MPYDVEKCSSMLREYHLVVETTTGNYCYESKLFSGWLFSATKLVNPFFALLDLEFAHTLGVSAAAYS